MPYRESEGISQKMTSSRSLLPEEGLRVPPRYTLYPGELPARFKLLRQLYDTGKGIISGDELGARVGISRTAVWKHMKSFVEEGYPIETLPNKGYRLTRALDAMMPDILWSHLETENFGRVILLTQTTGSTNDDLKSIAGSYPEGTVLIAETQTGGKGRIGRRWSSPKGGISASILLKPTVVPAMAPLISLVAGYSVALALRQTLSLDAKLKWPNDVLVNGRKVCGILCEMRSELDRIIDTIAGIGVNVNLKEEDLPPEVRETATSLEATLGKPVDRSILMADILNAFERSYREFLARGLSRLGQSMALILAFIGEEVTLRNLTSGDSTEMRGIFKGIDPQGRALLETPDGENITVSAGDLSLRRAR